MIANTPINLYFYQNDIEKPSIWLAIAAPILKNAWGLATATIIIGLVHRYGWILLQVMSFDGFRIIGRISYATMIIQFIVIKLMVTTASHLPMLGDLGIVSHKRSEFSTVLNFSFIFSFRQRSPTTSYAIS
jgi:peptidoglycan/LPS O-acetylase OafA/YrhL